MYSDDELFSFIYYPVWIPHCVLTANADKVGGDGYGSSQHRILFARERWSVVYLYAYIWLISVYVPWYFNSEFVQSCISV